MYYMLYIMNSGYGEWTLVKSLYFFWYFQGNLFLFENKSDL